MKDVIVPEGNSFELKSTARCETSSVQSNKIQGKIVSQSILNTVCYSKNIQNIIVLCQMERLIWPNFFNAVCLKYGHINMLHIGQTACIWMKYKVEKWVKMWLINIQFEYNTRLYIVALEVGCQITENNLYIFMQTYINFRKCGCKASFGFKCVSALSTCSHRENTATAHLWTRSSNLKWRKNCHIQC